MKTKLAIFCGKYFIVIVVPSVSFFLLNVYVVYKTLACFVGVES